MMVQNQNELFHEKLRKARQKKQEEFDQQVTNMLIHLYNGKECHEYIKEYKSITDIVNHISLTFIAHVVKEAFRS